MSTLGAYLTWHAKFRADPTSASMGYPRPGLRGIEGTLHQVPIRYSVSEFGPEANNV